MATSRLGITFLVAVAVVVGCAHRPQPLVGKLNVETLMGSTKSFGVPGYALHGNSPIPLTSSSASEPEPPKTPVTLAEAVAVAEWFCRSVDLSPEYRFDSAWLDRSAARQYGAPLYHVVLRRVGQSSSIAVSVDSQSGDVLFAYDSAEKGAGKPTISKQTDIWTSRIYGSKRVSRDSNLVNYDAAIDSHPFLNMNGETRATFLTKDGAFTWFAGFGATPPGATASPTISSAQAVSNAFNEKLKSDTGPPGSQVVKSEIGLYYDDKKDATRWIWKVTQGRNFKGRYFAGNTAYVDAQNGRLLTDNEIQWSRWMYKSRAPRAGLSRIPKSSAVSPIIAVAEQKLKEMGRQGLHFDRIEGVMGLQMTSLGGLELRLNSNGDLVSFQGPALPGKLDSQVALAKGKAFILAQHPHLPGGSFEVSDPQLSQNTEVCFRQRAMGYEVLGEAVASVSFASNGVVTRFALHPQSDLIPTVPGRVLSPTAVEDFAQAWAKPQLQKDTDRIHYYVSVKAGKLGWYANPKTGRVRLCYEVAVMFERDVKNWARQGGGREHMFDAETGECLDAQP